MENKKFQLVNVITIMTILVWGICLGALAMQKKMHIQLVKEGHAQYNPTTGEIELIPMTD